MAEFTLLEVHLDDSSFTVDAPFVGEQSAQTDASDGIDDGDSGGFPLLPVLALVALAVAAVAAKKLLGGESDAE